MDLTLTTRTAGDRTVVEVGGEIDVYTAPQLRNAISDAVAGGACRIVVDLSGTRFLDSTGLGVLVGGLKRARTGGGDLELVCADERVLKVFRLTGLTKVFTLHATIEDALPPTTPTRPSG